MVAANGAGCALPDSGAHAGGLHLAGNAYEGIGIPDCIRMGRRAAERILGI